MEHQGAALFLRNPCDNQLPDPMVETTDSIVRLGVLGVGFRGVRVTAQGVCLG